MPFDYEEYDAKCSQMTVEQLHKEWENYTRQIAGGATGTAISSMAVPFTAGVSLIGVGMSAPRIHNARKKREIIEKYLQAQNTTHNTRKRDVLMPMAVSGVINSLTLGLATPGADMVMEAGATHGVEMIVASEVGTKVATHAALDVSGQAFEEAHARHDKKKGEKKLVQQATQITVIEVPGPNGTIGKIYQAQVNQAQFLGPPGTSGHSSTSQGGKQYDAVAIPLPYSRPGTPQPPPAYSPPSPTPSSATPSSTAPSYDSKVQNDAKDSSPPSFPPRPLPVPLQQASTHSYVGPPYHLPASTMQGALPHSYSAPLYAPQPPAKQNFGEGMTETPGSQQLATVTIVTQSLAALSHEASESPSSTSHGSYSKESDLSHPAVTEPPTTSSFPARPVSPFERPLETQSLSSTGPKFSRQNEVKEGPSKPQTPVTNQQNVQYPPPPPPQAQDITDHNYSGQPTTQQKMQHTPQQQYGQPHHMMQPPPQHASQGTPQPYYALPAQASNQYQSDSDRHSYVTPPVILHVTQQQYTQQAIHQQYSQPPTPQYYAHPSTQSAQQQYAAPSMPQQSTQPPSQQHYSPPPIQHQKYSPPAAQQHFNLPPQQHQYPPPPAQLYTSPPTQQHYSPPPTYQHSPSPIQYQQQQQQPPSPLPSPHPSHTHQQQQHHYPPPPTATSSPPTQSHPAHQPYNPQNFIQPYVPQAVAAAAVGTGQYSQQIYGEKIGGMPYSQPPMSAPVSGMNGGVGGVGYRG